MFERYTEPARRALFFARFESSQFGSLSIEPEHLLLGIAREGGPLLAKISASSSVESIRTAVNRHVQTREKVSTSIEIPFSMSTKHVLQYGAEEADWLRHRHIGPEHLLLGILREGASRAAAVLAEQGLDLERTRRQVEELRKTTGEPEEPPLIAPGEAHAHLRVRSAAFDEYVELIKQRVQELGTTDDAAARRDLVYQIVTALDSLRDRI